MTRVITAARRWRTALAAGLVLATVFGVIEGFSIFYSAFVPELGLDRAQASGMFALFLVCSTLVAPIAGGVVSRYGPRRVILTALPAFAGAVAACGLATALWQFYVLYTTVLSTATTLLVVASQVLVNSAYDQQRGRATGLAYACLGVGNFVCFSLLALVVDQLGWRAGYAVGGVLALLGAGAFATVTRPAARPAERSEVGPAGTDATEANPDSTGAAPLPTRRRLLLRRRALWLVCAAALLAAVTDFFTFQTMVPFLTTEGRSVALSGFLLGLTGLSYSAGQLLGGMLSDRTSRELAGTVGGGGFLSGLALLWWLPPLPLLVTAIVLLGMSVGVIVGCRIATTGDLFTGAELGKATGIIQMGSAIGSAFATWFGGFSYSVSGDYGMAFVAAAVAAMAWIVVLWSAAPRRARTALGRATRIPDQCKGQRTTADHSDPPQPPDHRPVS